MKAPELFTHFYYSSISSWRRLAESQGDHSNIFRAPRCLSARGLIERDAWLSSTGLPSWPSSVSTDPAMFLLMPGGAWLAITKLPGHLFQYLFATATLRPPPGGQSAIRTQRAESADYNWHRVPVWVWLSALVSRLHREMVGVKKPLQGCASICCVLLCLMSQWQRSTSGFCLLGFCSPL